jgi:predicted Ser/Thr protein kinase
MQGRIFYTGKVIAEDQDSIKIFTIRGEELILNKNEIFQAKRIDDSIEGED